MNNNNKIKVIYSDDCAYISKEMFEQVVIPLLQDSEKGREILANINKTDNDNKLKSNNKTELTDNYNEDIYD